MPFDAREYFDAFEEARPSARWSFFTGLSLGCVVWLAQAEWLRRLIGPDFGSVRFLALVLPLICYWKYVRARSAGLAQAEGVAARFTSEAQATERARLLGPLDWVRAHLIAAEWNRAQGFVEVTIEAFSPSPEPKALRSVRLADVGVTPVSLEVVAPGVRDFVLPLVSGETHLTVGGDRDRCSVVLKFRRSGDLPRLSLSSDTWATRAQFVLHADPRLKCEGTMPITGVQIA